MTRLNIIFAVGALAMGAFANSQERPFSLMVGDKAPEIKVSKWVKGEPVTKFGDGNIYVVEFWATWCGPCKTSIPHLTELQSKYGDKVKIVGVSIWESDQSNVEPFVAEWGPKMDYTVAMDVAPEGEEGVMAETWMRAGGRNGIPSAFIVDGEGKIAWVGHPMQMDEPLEAVVNGTWDAKAFVEKNLAAWNKEAASQKFGNEMNALLKAEKTDEALAHADKALAEGNLLGFGWKYRILSGVKKDKEATLKFLDESLANEKLALNAAMTKYNYLVAQKDYDAAFEVGHKLVDKYAKDNWNALNSLAWTMVMPDTTFEKQDLDLALKAAERSVEIEKGWANLDTLARVHFVRGDKAKAAEYMREAIAMAPQDQKVALEKTLKEYEAS